MPIYWDEKAGMFVVPEGECPYPIAGQDNTPPCASCGCGYAANDKVDESGAQRPHIPNIPL